MNHKKHHKMKFLLLHAEINTVNISHTKNIAYMDIHAS